MAIESDAEKAPPMIEAFVRQLVVANKAVQLYPPMSAIPQEAAAAVVVALNTALEEYSEFTLAVAKQGIFFGEAPIFPGQPTFAAFAMELYNRRLSLVRFHAGATPTDIIAFLTVLKSSPEEVAAGGGYEAMIWEHGSGSVTVVETTVTLTDQTMEDAGEDEGDESLDTRTTAVQMRSNAPRTRERIELTRVGGDRRALQEYLTERYDTDGSEIGLGEMRKRFIELARMAAESTGSNADNFMRVFADALWGLEPGLRQELLGSQLLPEARASETVAGAMRRIDLEEIVRMLADGIDDFDERKIGFVRALKNLVQINQVDRERVTQAATTVLREKGMSEANIKSIITQGAPTRLTVRRAAAPLGVDSAAATVLKLINHAPLAKTADGTSDPELAALQDEAAIGVTDGDIIAALVALAGLDAREQQFANTMSALEDALDVLVSRGEMETAAEAAISLFDAAQDPKLTPEQCRRLEDAITRFARPEDIRGITHTLRIYQPGQPEYEAAQRLLNTLGVLAIRPMLEQLSNEQDRAERKALVDLISKDADKYILELGSHVTDSRWFFVRNVVAILGSTKSSEAIGPLERTIRHSDERVRRETIRAASMIQDRRAIEMLIVGLDDEDPHNVQLAARYLGLKGARNAAPALEAVASGEGRGNRENGPRVEAIEALGRMGATEALPTLDAIARKRSIIGSSRIRELRTAANAAIQTIRAKGGA